MHWIGPYEKDTTKQVEPALQSAGDYSRELSICSVEKTARPRAYAAWCPSRINR